MTSPHDQWRDKDQILLPESQDAGRLSAFVLLNPILRYRWLLVLSILCGVAAAAAFALLQVRTYEAVVRFVTSPGTARTVAGVGGDLGPIQQRDPFEYYNSVLTSSEVMDAVLDAKASDGTTVRNRLRLAPGVTRQEARATLATAEARLDASSRSRTAGSLPVLMVKASWDDPQMAADLANAFFDALATYDKGIRSSAAKERAAFIATQIELTAIRLKTAEDDLQEFTKHNRLLMLADAVPVGARSPVPPALELRRSQLQREVTVQGELYLTLKKAFDQAQIAGLDDASGLVVIEKATPPSTPSGVARRRMVAVGGLIGLAIGGVLTLGFELRRRADLSTPDAQEFVGHITAIRRDVTGLRARAARALAPPPQPEQPPVKRDA